MQAAVSRATGSTSLHVGDVAWVAKQHTHRQLSLAVRIWEDENGHVIAWTFLRTNGGFNIFVAPEDADDSLVDQAFLAITEMANLDVRAGDPPVDLHTYGIDPSRSDADRALWAGLKRHGFTLVPESGGLLGRELADVPEPSLPAGFSLAFVESPEQIVGRVEAHREAFAPF